MGLTQIESNGRTQKTSAGHQRQASSPFRWEGTLEEYNRNMIALSQLRRSCGSVINSGVLPAKHIEVFDGDETKGIRDPGAAGEGIADDHRKIRRRSVVRLRPPSQEDNHQESS